MLDFMQEMWSQPHAPAIMWGLLFVSIALTIRALLLRVSDWMLIVAICLSLAFSLVGSMSLGIWTIVLTFVQLALVVKLNLRLGAKGMLIVGLIFVIIWLILFSAIGNPWGLKSP